ncbi:MAG: 50S ribosomal protein L22 [Candidatus Lloydbacteria bacterium RIFOXYC12_FULL_46_25]|uniref:Large ribosomal subunit protein uL22 n=1 Tax=Candidatus Lloydbacteria bacterium RIFOXYC12_FULL_46_25 TaxID=1798670 RepID=A0A1G2DTZ3_9BACT|nr:MAG: 50S ribosomal protein L22 [Candidatus Lloydbacteria bacterium RIFOXYC12_FULL_46_25]
MEATATLSQYRQSPRKTRLLADLVRGKKVEDAILQLDFRAKRSAPIFVKLIKSAVANAKAAGLDEKALVVKSITVDKGPILKRSRPRAHGRAFPIHKHTSHITVTLADKATLVTKKALKKAGVASVVKTAPATKKTIAKTVTKKKAATKAE